MSLEAELAAHAPGRPTVVTVGTFDGVHAGHRRLLGKVAAIARRSRAAGGAAGVAITFRQQPRSVLRPGAPTTYLCTLEERLRLIADAGVDVVIPVDFTEQVRSRRPREFMQLLCEELRMTDFVIGPGAAVGYHREGRADALAALGRELGFNVHSAPGTTYRGEVISSTAVRQALAEGRVDDARAMLERPFRFQGVVERGERRGRALSFPTANLSPRPHTVTPGDGVYAAWARIERDASAASAAPVGTGGRHPAAVSIGVRPTFGGGRRLVEAFLLDFEGDLYGKTLTVEFVARLRPEQRFDSASLLVAQMKKDVEATRLALGV